MGPARILNHPVRHYLKLSWLSSFIRSKYRYVIFPELFQWKMMILMHIPGRIGSFFRKKLMGFKSVGNGSVIYDHAYFRAPWNISIGDDVRIHPMTFLDGVGGIEIGSHLGITSGVQIYTQNHGAARNQLYYYQPSRLAKVVIEDDCWIGAGTLIMAGVTIRKGTIVAAGSVVTKTTEEYSIIAGVPARKIKDRA